jgi:hypothetical protein
MFEQTAFISGHVDLSSEEFKENYVKEIDIAIASGDKFVVGCAKGGDTMGLEYLLECKVDPTRITIFLFERYSSDETCKEKYNKLYPEIALKYGYKSYSTRDAAMTNSSDYDIAWVRSEAECKKKYGDKYRPRVSGTEQNLIRRRLVKQQSFKAGKVPWGLYQYYFGGASDTDPELIESKLTIFEAIRIVKRIAIKLHQQFPEEFKPLSEYTKDQSPTNSGEPTTNVFFTLDYTNEEVAIAVIKGVGSPETNYYVQRQV